MSTVPAAMRRVVHRWRSCAHVVRALPGGSANLSAHVRLGAEDFVFRLYLQSDLPRFRIECNTLARLSAIGAPTPTVVEAGESAPGRGTPYLVYRMLPGTTLTEAATRLRRTELASAIGRVAEAATAASDALRVDAFGYLHVSTPSPVQDDQTHHDVEAYSQTIAEHGLLQRDLLRRTRLHAEGHLALTKTNSPCLVHPDLKPSNVLVGHDAVYLLDWELPVGGHPVLSYGGLLAEGVIVDHLMPALRTHLYRLPDRTRVAAITAGILRVLETLSYLPSNPPYQQGRQVRPDHHQLAHAAATLLDWLP